MGRPADFRDPALPRAPQTGQVGEGPGRIPDTPGTCLPRELGEERAGKQKRQMKVNRPGAAQRTRKIGFLCALSVLYYEIRETWAGNEASEEIYVLQTLYPALVTCPMPVTALVHIFAGWMEWRMMDGV